MTIRPAAPADLPAIRRLLQDSRRSFLACGLEDVPELLHTATTAVGVGPGEEGGVWGFVAFAQVDAPHTAPGSLHSGALRAVALAQRRPAGASAGRLVNQVVESRQASGQPFQLTALSGETWLVQLLRARGFAIADYLCFYQRTRRSLPAPPEGVHLRPLHQDELPALALLDSLTFPPLWRMGEAEQIELCFTSRLQAAEVDGQLVGYAATVLHLAQDRYDEDEAQIARLAVHPAFQGQGIGRQLLIDSIAYAHAHGCYRILLNTPESNRASQNLYASLHFRRRGKRMPVLVYNSQAMFPVQR